MASIPIHNETDYILTEAMREEIIRDVRDHFGDEVHSIRVQAGRERHALNTRTREIRYAFFPQDFGMRGDLPIAPMTPARSVAKPHSAGKIGAEDTPGAHEDIEEEEDLTLRGRSLAHFGMGQADREEDDRFTLDNQNEEEDEEDEEDEEEDEDEEEEEDEEEDEEKEEEKEEEED